MAEVTQKEVSGTPETSAEHSEERLPDLRILNPWVGFGPKNRVYEEFGTKTQTSSEGGKKKKKKNKKKKAKSEAADAEDLSDDEGSTNNSEYR